MQRIYIAIETGLMDKLTTVVEATRHKMCSEEWLVEATDFAGVKTSRRVSHHAQMLKQCAQEVERLERLAAGHLRLREEEQ